MVLDLLEYDPADGTFRWLRSGRGRRAGEIAGTLIDSGKGGRKYWRLRINNRFYKAHRIAFLIMEGWLPEMVDHENGDSTCNVWSNLRAATSLQNARNRRVHSNNALGVKGVIRTNGRFRVRIHAGRNINVGWFDDLDEAKAAYEAAAKMHHGEWARAAA
ncbi:HNH endonuclease [Bradyrhizobium sp. SZCCHNR3118]|uniref:HNH endonuclease n=1 Tax=Bradyrhizobium sp. SZCCHNR3118 TaxID=3057468 RepID=UPI002916850A|nr:HNH endonuclease [Bradyrhizobium sp. SZCCHNR3118]